MSVKVDIREFVADYCRGVKDRDLLAKHQLKPNQMVVIIKKLMNEGVITKEQYFTRNRIVEEAEIHEEKRFLKSLYHCPVCSHMHPHPFHRCPACGTEVARSRATSTRGESPPGNSPVPAQEIIGEGLGSAASAFSPKAVELPNGPLQTPSEDAVPTHSRVSADWLKLVGMRVEQFSLLPGTLTGVDGENYELNRIIAAAPHAALYEIGSADDKGPNLSLRVFDSCVAEGADLGLMLQRIIQYQSTMVDPNVIKVYGSASLQGHQALVHEYGSMSLETLVRQEPEGLSLDMIMELLPQILNSVGYSHLHRGTDGVVRRLPHLSLQLSSFLFDDRKKVVKLMDCGVLQSLIDLRGHRRRLSEEPAVDPSCLAPEAFLLEPKSLNAFSVDIYGVGVLLYRLLTGKSPFSASNTDEYGFAHLKTFPVPPRVHKFTIPAWLDAMILKCLEKEPAKRWRSATQMELSISKALYN